MHLPWYQVHKKAKPRWQTMGKFLGIPSAHARGIVSALWEWAFEIAAEGDFSGLVPDRESIAAAVDWPIDDAMRLVQELERAGFVSTSPKLRVKGLDMYIETWVRNGNDRDARKKLVRLASGQPYESPTPLRSDAGVTPEPLRSQTKTHKKKEDLSQQQDLMPPVPAVPRTKRPRRASVAEEFFAWLTARRAEKTALSDEPAAPGLINATFGRALHDNGRPELEKRYLVYLDEPDGASCEPPWPWRRFLARHPYLKDRAAKLNQRPKPRVVGPTEDPYAAAT